MGQVKAMLMDKIEERMDQLQAMMESQEHIENPYKVLNHIASITKFWSVLSDEDKDYIDSAKYAAEGKMEWNV